MSDWQHNLRSILKEKKLTQEDLATKLGMTQGAVGHWLTGRRNIDVCMLQTIADTLDIPIENLFSRQFYAAEKPASYSAQIKPTLLISWERANDWPKNQTKKPLASFVCPIVHGPNTYALRIENDSMQASQGRSYPEGAVIFVDPDAVNNIQSGDRVIAKLSSHKKAVFKTFVEDGHNQFLKSLNPDYPIIKRQFTLIGKVIGMWLGD